MYLRFAPWVVTRMANARSLESPTRGTMFRNASSKYWLQFSNRIIESRAAAWNVRDEEKEKRTQHRKRTTEERAVFSPRLRSRQDRWISDRLVGRNKRHSPIFNNFPNSTSRCVSKKKQRTQRPQLRLGKILTQLVWHGLRMGKGNSKT